MIMLVYGVIKKTEKKCQKQLCFNPHFIFNWGILKPRMLELAVKYHIGQFIQMDLFSRYSAVKFYDLDTDSK